MIKNFVVGYLVRKLKEPSTSAGLAILLMSSAPMLTPFAEGVTAIIGALFGIGAMLLDEKHGVE